jgi:dihydrolipoamide dehydrogenase
MEKTAQIIVIGGGPGGYVAAIRAAQLGFSVVCVDKRASLGGTCLNEGCIPSKALLHASSLYQETHSLGSYGIDIETVSLNLKTLMARKDSTVKELTQGIDFLFRKNKITRLIGMAQLGENNTVILKREGTPSEVWTAEKAIIIATGSEPIVFPGLEVDEKTILSSKGALALEQVPSDLVVLGGGYIGLEMGSVWSRLGSRVTVIERMDRLVPGMDHDISQGLEKNLSRQGLTFLLSHTLTRVERQGGKLMLEIEGTEEKRSLETDALLVSLGRKPLTAGLGLEERGIHIDETGRIPVNQRFETTCPGIYAIGDVIRGPMLAHKASDEGVAVVEILAGQAGHVNYSVIPSVVYTHPQAASVGKTEQELQREGIPYKTGKFPFAASSRAKVTGETEGFVKMLSHSKTDRLLGVHILGADAETLIGEAALALEFSASSEDIARTCHAHPSYSEILKEAALAVSGAALHI